MKVEQEKRPFIPIKITLESEVEAKAFFDLIDRIDQLNVSGSDIIFVSKIQKKIVSILSDARTNGDIDI